MDTNIKSKLEVIAKKFRENTSYQYKIFIIVFLSLMLIFCTSKIYIPETNNISATKIGETKKLDSTTNLSLYSWKYNTDTGQMEMILSIESTSGSYNKQLSVSAVTYNGKKLKTDVVYSSPEIIVVQLNNLKAKSFKGIKISISSETEKSTKDSSNTSSFIQQTNINKADFVCNSQSVEIDNLMSEKSDVEYKKIGLEIQVEKLEKRVSELENENKTSADKVTQLQKDISILDEKKEYQTEDEKKKTISIQQSKRTEINRLNRTISDNQKLIDDINSSKSKLKSILG